MSSLTVPIPPDHGPACRAGNTDLGTVPPHAWIERAGKKISTHDLVGTGEGFLLVAGSAGSAWRTAARKTSAKPGVPITAVFIGEGGECSDSTGEWARVSELDADSAILVRPDNHVAWRARGNIEHAGDALTDAVSSLIRSQ
jgi:2,4-dichlorophenol 6-monooxygenase